MKALAAYSLFGIADQHDFQSGCGERTQELGEESLVKRHTGRSCAS